MSTNEFLPDVATTPEPTATVTAPTTPTTPTTTTPAIVPTTTTTTIAAAGIPSLNNDIKQLMGSAPSVNAVENKQGWIEFVFVIFFELSIKLTSKMFKTSLTRSWLPY